ncbi:DUF3710 domain-containing protein [Nocardioides antri]|uniref:DUF3710 domain-containing protein n=1 Tax=Nocardioides antri TaxID=2607659 RepID=A0A5B1M880_9ACTN|nr:DUF3710 domain-containing protein [Nocardioides antri]KAA1429081.1 DUF3710 domain-containing protein [Nocardioides antri]
MRFRRKSDEAGPEDTPDTAVDDAIGAVEAQAEAGDDAAEGPFDADDLPEDGVARIDLGALLVAPVEGRDLRVQIDEKSGNVRSVVLAGPDGAVELRAYAAPRNGDLWSEVRPQIAADAARRGGTATENDGPFGTELYCEVQVTTAEGKVGSQTSRVVGFNGPRWLLRATFLGRPARDPEALAEWRSAVTSVAVRRGNQAMPVGEQLPLTLPEDVKAQAEAARASAQGQQTEA